MNRRFEITDDEWELLAGRCCWGAGLGRPGRLHRGPSPPARRWCPQRGLSTIQASRQQALSRSRGGLTTKLHTVCDGRGRNLATRLTPGQDADTTQLVGLVDQVRVARPGRCGRPRMRPDHLTGDKAYSSRANRAALRARRIPHIAVADIFIWLHARPDQPRGDPGNTP